MDEAEKICDRVAILKTKLIATGSPDELRTSLTTRRIQVRLQSVDDSIVKAVNKLGYQIAEKAVNSLIIPVKDPEMENPVILQEIQNAGGRLQFVTEIGSSLEDVYLKLVKES